MIQELLGVRVQPHLPPPTGLSAAMFDATTIAVTFTVADATATTEVWRDGVSVHTCAAGIGGFNDTGLSGGVAYAYQVNHRKPSTGGYSPRTPIVFGFTSLPAPLALGASLSDNNITLHWTNTAPEFTRIYRGGVLYDVVAVGVTSYFDGALADGTYSYTVRHFDGSSSESGDSNADGATVDVMPDTPSSFTAVPISSSENDLSWVYSDISATFEIYRSTSPSPTGLLGTSSSNGYADTSASAGVLYYYQVRALHGTHYSGYSGDASVTTDAAGPTGAPTGLSVGTPFTDRATVAWTCTDPLSDTEIFRDGSSLTSVSPTVASFNDDSVAQGSSHTYAVRHVRNGQTSSFSGSASATQPNAGITSASITADIGDDHFVMSFIISPAPRSATAQLTGWDDGDGESNPTPQTIGSPHSEGIGFTIVAKSPGVNHEVTVTCGFAILDSGSSVVYSDGSTFQVSFYKPGP